MNISRSYIYALSGRGIGILNSLVVIYLGSHLLTKAHQGLFYALTSISAAQVLFEMGFSSVLLQFVGHEKQELNSIRSDAKKNIALDDITMRNIRDILRIADRWFSFGGILCLAVMYAIAVFMFDKESQTDWMAPSLTTSVSVALNLTFVGRWAIYEGYGFIQDVLLGRLVAALLSLTLTLLLFFFGYGIFVPTVASLSMVMAYFLCIRRRGQHFWNSLKIQKETGDSSIVSGLQNSLLKLQLRTAISYMCGYFSFQVITLIAYKIGSPSLASTIGISMTIMMACISFAGIFIQTQQQSLFRLIAERKMEDYFSLGYSLMKRGFVATLVLASTGLIILKILREYNVDWLLDRLPDTRIFLLFMGVTAINQAIATQATLVRSFKKEPYIGHSMAVALSVTLVAIWAAHFNNPTLYALAYFGVNLVVALPYSALIFLAEKKNRLRSKSQQGDLLNE